MIRGLRRTVSPALALLAAAGGCGRSPAGPDPIRPDEDACAECRMQILQPRFAAEVLAPGGEYLKFDDIGCFRSRIAKDARLAAAPAWVADFETGRWVDARSASYIVGTGEKTPMASGILAFAEKRRAAARGAPLTLDEMGRARTAP